MTKLIARAMVSMTLILSASTAFAAACVSGPLAGYIALGASGCQLGPVTVSDFGSFSPPAGIDAIPLDSVTVVPQTVDAATVGLDFLTAGSAGGFHVVRAVLIGYRLQGAVFDSETVMLSGVDLFGDGSARATLDTCSNGIFSAPGSCSGTISPALTRVVVRSVLNETGGSASQALAGATMLSVITSLALDSGQEGGARAAATGDRFGFAVMAPVPEPALTGLLTGGLLALVFVRRARSAAVIR